MINSLSIKNYKSIKKSSCDFPLLSVSAMVGKNAAGKTNVLQVIAILKELVAGDSIDEIIAKLVLVPNELFNKDDSEKSSAFSIVVSGKDEIKYRLEISLEIINGNVPANFIISKEKLETEFDGRQLTIYERKGNQIEDDNGNPIQLTVDSKKLFVSLYTKNEAQAVRDIFQNIRIPESKLIDSRDTIVGITEKNLAGLLIDLRHNEPAIYSDFEKVAKKLLPTFSAITELAARPDAANTSASEEQYLVLFQEKNLRGQLSMKVSSAGDIRTLYIIAAAMGMPQYGTLIIEEIENGIHQKRIEEIVDHLETISRVKNIQIIFTTHSERIINRMAAQYVIYVEKDLSKGTHLDPLTGPAELAQIKLVLEKGGSLSDYLSTR